MPEVLERWLPPSLEPGPERWLFLLVSLSVALGLISIAASQALFFSAVLGFVWERRRGRVSAPPRPAGGRAPPALFFLAGGARPGPPPAPPGAPHRKEV